MNREVNIFRYGGDDKKNEKTGETVKFYWQKIIQSMTIRGPKYSFKGVGEIKEVNGIAVTDVYEVGVVGKSMEGYIYQEENNMPIPITRRSLIPNGSDAIVKEIFAVDEASGTRRDFSTEVEMLERILPFGGTAFKNLNNGVGKGSNEMLYISFDLKRRSLINKIWRGLSSVK